LGVGNAAWYDCEEQTESLLNAHELRKHNVLVDDKAKLYGGNQNIVIGDTTICLDFIDGKTMSFYNRKPTNKEMEEIEVLWLSLRITVPGNFARRRLYGEVIDEVLPWKERLGNCPETLRKLYLPLNSFVFPQLRWRIENILDKLLPLHPRRIPGRTDSYTFFSKVKSVRGFLCVQIFHCLDSGYILVCGMARQCNSHSTFEDFIRKIGAANILLTDNAQASVGKKWTTTSWIYSIKQVASTPNFANQNTAERKLAVVKHRVLLTLRYSEAPLVFWCYCMNYVVD
jgi:hypothetical protein